MSKVLTEKAETTADLVIAWLRFGLYVFVGFALAQHIGWMDATAATFVITQVVRAIRMSGVPR